MFVDEELKELKERISRQSDSELLRIVEVERDDYRPEAIDFASSELLRRGVSFKPARNVRGDADEESASYLAPSNESLEPCKLCGGEMRGGWLLAGSELTILFSDTNEERFVEALACRRCGGVKLVVDFETDVEG